MDFFPFRRRPQPRRDAEDRPVPAPAESEASGGQPPPPAAQADDRPAAEDEDSLDREPETDSTDEFLPSEAEPEPAATEAEAGPEPPDHRAEEPVRADAEPPRLSLRRRPRERPPDAGYRTSDEHLHDELARIDYLVRAQAVRWLATIAEHKPERLWGMLHVTDSEVQAYLESDFMPPPELPEEIEEALEPYWTAAAEKGDVIERRLAHTPPGVPLRLRRLRELYDLSALQRDVLLVCLLPELDTRYRRLFGYLQDDASRLRPSVELILQILRPDAPDPAIARAAFAPSSTLLTAPLIVVESEEQADAALAVRGARLDDRIVDYLLGGQHLDSRLRDMVSLPHHPVEWSQLIVEPERLKQWQALADWWLTTRREETAPTVFLHGPYGSGRLAAALAICTATQTPLLIADAAAALRSPHGFERVVALAYREARLRDAALYWSHGEALLDALQPPHVWSHLVGVAEHAPGLTFLASQTPWDPVGRFQQRPFFRLDFPAPAYDLRLRLWLAHLRAAQPLEMSEEGRRHLAERLANGFQLTEGQIIDAVATARHLALQRNPAAPRVTEADLYEGCRRQSGRRLVTLAHRVEPRSELSFRDLVLPRPSRVQLRELRNRIRYRNEVLSGVGFERRITLGKGLITLFTGSSGTGKTMAAQLLASEQGVDLYKIDMSAVVSKYIGETEKNLNQVFAEAEDSNAIVFFDEADALFGKRGKVEEGRDRYANIEIDYLLQRVEEYSGVVVLATNLRQNIDEAFIRRIHVIVDFPFPEAPARYRIWLGLFPPGVVRPPKRQIHDLAQRFRLAGGSLQNIVIDATFRARARKRDDDESPLRVTLKDLVLGIAREYQKLGKPITKGDFGDEFYGWIDQTILAPVKPPRAVQHG